MRLSCPKLCTFYIPPPPTWGGGGDVKYRLLACCSAMIFWENSIVSFAPVVTIVAVNQSCSNLSLDHVSKSVLYHSYLPMCCNRSENTHCLLFWAMVGIGVRLKKIDGYSLETVFWQFYRSNGKYAEKAAFWAINLNDKQNLHRKIRQHCFVFAEIISSSLK